MSSSVPLARTGRHQQRYDNNFRLVSGCIPYRIAEDDGDDQFGDIENRIQVLMVSSPDRHDRVFPKGGWEDDETVLEAACREAFEEAGVKGTLRETPLGVWEFRSKSREEMCSLSLEGGCRGYMFALEVTQELDTWPEQQNRDRKWLSIKEAFRVCRYEWMRKALEQFLRVMAEVSICDDDDIDEGVQVKVVEMMTGSEDQMKGEELPSSDSTLHPLPQAASSSDVEHVVAECKIVSSNCYIKPASSSASQMVNYICSQDQLADIFTKGLSSSRFKLLVSKLPVVPQPVSLRGAVRRSQGPACLPRFEEL